MIRSILSRELGAYQPKRLFFDQELLLSKKISLSSSRIFKTNVTVPIQCLASDSVQGRLLLAGGGDGSLELFDLIDGFDSEGNGPPIARVPKKIAHKHTISTVGWFPFDTGLFFTGAFDKVAKIWDSRRMEVACSFNMGSLVFQSSMSRCASTHSLMAVATARSIRLCDLVSGGFTHSITAPQGDPILTLQWFPWNEYLLVSGGADGHIRLWDIRSGAQSVGTLSATASMSAQTPGANKDSVFMSSVSRPSPSSSAARAHDCPIACLKFLPDGLSLVSLGGDGQAKRWDALSGVETHTSYPRLRRVLTGNVGLSGSVRVQRGRQGREVTAHQLRSEANGMRSVQLACSVQGDRLYFPHGTRILEVDALSGQVRQNLSGHMDKVFCLHGNSHRSEIYSSGTDNSLLIWEPPSPVAPAETGSDDEDLSDWGSD